MVPRPSQPTVAAAPGSRDLLYPSLGLVLKIAGVVLAVVSLTKLSLAHQQRLDNHLAVSAHLKLQVQRLQERQRQLDRLFSLEGQQEVFQQEQQWIAPNRRRIVWLPAPAPELQPKSQRKPQPSPEQHP